VLIRTYQKDMATFHSGEQGELEHITEHVEPKLSRVTEKWPIDVVELKTPRELIWDLTKNFLVSKGYCTKFLYSRRWDYSTWEITWKIQVVSTTRWFGIFTRQTFFANESHKWRWISAQNPSNVNVQCKSFPF